MKFNLKKVFYLDGVIVEHNIITTSYPEILAKKINEESVNLEEEMAIEIARAEKPTSHYIPEKLRRDECYVRFEVYPIN